MFQEDKRSGKETGVVYSDVIKDAFIRFLKDHHAWDEYKDELLLTKGHAFEELWDFVELKETLLSNGCCFFWNSGISDVDWKDLHEKWIAILQAIGYVFSIDMEDLIDV